MGRRLGRENGAGATAGSPLWQRPAPCCGADSAGAAGRAGGWVGGPPRQKKEPAGRRAKGAGYSANMGPER